MKLPAVVVFLLFLCPAFAQKTIWLDEDGHRTHKKNASSYCHVTLQKSAEHGNREKLYQVEEFYMTGELYQTGTYSTKNLTKKEGDFTTYVYSTFWP